MDLYEIFYEYKINGKTPSNLRGQRKDVRDLVKLMRETKRNAQNLELDLADAQSYCDHLFITKSWSRINAMATKLEAKVSMEWVQACASQVDPKGTLALEMLDETSNRHVHVISPDIQTFLTKLREAKNKTITFSTRSTAQNAIHLSILYNNLKQLCYNEPVLWFMIACSIGIPTHDLYTPTSFICKWRKEPNRKILSNDNIVKTLLGPMIETNGIRETEISQLVRKFHEMESDFKNNVKVDTVDEFMFKRVYAYPTSEEITQLRERVQINMNYTNKILTERKPLPESPPVSHVHNLRRSNRSKKKQPSTTNRSNQKQTPIQKQTPKPTEESKKQTRTRTPGPPPPPSLSMI